MAPDQLFPLEVNPRTQEPFLRLRKHKNIILTPMRWEDASSLVPLFNDKRPYTKLTPTEDAEERLQKHKPPSDVILQELKDAQGSETLKMVNGAPVSYIRELQEDGSDIFLGNIAIGRCFHGELMGTNTIDWEYAMDRGRKQKS
ncbi:unnamed protein product [Cyclocybe aegerita]|uniref:Uncharacterized protein n=1 Tax=Cyclocybe aegerita TaxID=1973307 RepID=A0A8S0WX95_CYCAE|nr:unnamed protein product [Cyclocybe aegerita]